MEAASGNDCAARDSFQAPGSVAQPPPASPCSLHFSLFTFLPAARSPLPLQSWALMEAASGNERAARDRFQAALRAAPNSAACYNAWALFEAGQGNEKGAREVIGQGKGGMWPEKRRSMAWKRECFCVQMSGCVSVKVRGVA